MYAKADLLLTNIAELISFYIYIIFEALCNYFNFCITILGEWCVAKSIAKAKF